MIFLRKKKQFFPLPPLSEYPLRGVAAALRPAEGRDAGPPPPADVPLIESIFFLPDFFASVRRFPPVVQQTDAPPAVTPGSRRPLSPIYNRCKTVRRLPALPSPPSVSSDRRRIPEQTAPRDAGNAVSRTKTNFEALEMPYL